MRRMLVMILALMAVALPAWGQEVKGGGERVQDFSLYGLHFRMKRDQVRQIFKANDDVSEIIKPPHGLAFLNLVFDNRDRLIEIKASWPRPDDPFAEEGLRRAIKEKFLSPITLKYRNLSAGIDERSNRAVVTLDILSLDMREEIINTYRDDYLKMMEEAK